MLPKGLVIPTFGQRQTLLLAFHFLRPQARRTIHAPDRYRAMLAKLYAAIAAEVIFAAPQESAAAESTVESTLGDGGVGEIRVHAVGGRPAVELEQMLSDLVNRGAQHVSLSVPLYDPGTPGLAEAARKTGFFFSGLGPAFVDGGDALLMQWLGTPLDAGKLQIYADQARELVSFIEADRATTGRR